MRLSYVVRIGGACSTIIEGAGEAGCAILGGRNDGFEGEGGRAGLEENKEKVPDRPCP